MRIFTRRKAATIAVIAAIGVGGGVALAYWTTGGSGSGSAATGTTSAVVVNQTGSAITGLYPGASAPLSGNFTNTTNPGSVYVTSVTAVVTTFSVQADITKPACTDADFTITGSSNTPGEIAHGSGVGAWSGLTLTFTDAGTNQDNCKNITVPITYTAN